MRILLAEDDPALGQALADGLRQLGYAVDWITDGTQAAAALADTTYAAAVLDWNLPRSSGPTIIAGMRRCQDATPVLLLTARDGLPDRVAGLDAGADDYVVKPVHLDELAARLHAAGVCRELDPNVVLLGHVSYSRCMLLLMDWMAWVALLGWAFIAWVLLGRAARAAGTGRLQVLGLAALLSWLLP